MPSFAKIEDGTVTALLIYDEGAQPDDMIPAGDAVIGSTWDGEAFTAPEPPVVTVEERRAAINSERERRLVAGFDFNGSTFDSDEKSMQRIAGAATLAGFAMGNGALPGNLLWSGGSLPFSWITRDNQVVQMDAPTAFAFGQAAARHETLHVFAAKAIKEMDPMPDDVTDDALWP